MGHVFSKRVKSWLAVRVTLCADGQWLFLIPSAPVPWFTAIGCGVMVVVGSWGLQVMLRSGNLAVAVGLALGGIVAICGRQLWRLTVPVVSISRQRGEVVFTKGQPILSLTQVANLDLTIYADRWRGYREVELSLVLTPGQGDQKLYIFNRAKLVLTPDESDRKILILNRNNFDHDSFRFHADSPNDVMMDLAQTLAKASELPLHVERRTEADVLPAPLA